MTVTAAPPESTIGGRRVALAQALRAARDANRRVRITVDGSYVGSGWFRFADGYAECEMHNVTEGRLSWPVETDGRMRVFGNHAIVNDVGAPTPMTCRRDQASNGLRAPSCRRRTTRATGPLIFAIALGCASSAASG